MSVSKQMNNERKNKHEQNAKVNNIDNTSVLDTKRNAVEKKTTLEVHNGSRDHTSNQSAGRGS
jgi:hypothetical protein